MADYSGIPYTDATWNPLAGCTPCSPGCENCWAARTAHRLACNPNPKVSSAYVGLTKMWHGRLCWTGEVRLLPERLSEPLHWRKPRVVFVASMGDLFHPDVPFSFQHAIWETMDSCPQHAFLILTKRPDIMVQRVRDYCAWRWGDTEPYLREQMYREDFAHVYHGATVCTQAEAEAKIPHLLRVPGKRWLSVEPALEEIRLRTGIYQDLTDGTCRGTSLDGVHGVVAGCESGNGRRVPPYGEWLTWMRLIRDTCASSGVRFYYKQGPSPDNKRVDVLPHLDGAQHVALPWR